MTVTQAKRTGAFLLLCAAALLSGCSPEAEVSKLDEIDQRGELRVGTLLSPNSYYLDHERQAGFEYELAEGFAENLDVELTMVPRYNLKDLFQLLESGKVDILAAGLDRTDKRSVVYRFGPAYQLIDQRIIYKQGTRERPRGLEDIRDEIVVVEGSSHHDYLLSLGDLYPQLQWRATDDHDAEELLDRVMNDDIAFTIADSNILDIKRRYYPDLSVAFTISENLPVAWAMEPHADDSLQVAVLDYFGELRGSGRLAHIEDQHFGHVSAFNYVDTSLYIDAVQTRLPEFMELFRQHSGTLDWRLLAAISYQESHWNPLAISPTGVRGMMMLTLPTAKSVGVESRLSAEQSIRGGARYLERMIQRVPARIPEPDRTWFALAAYNVGFGHLEDGRRLTEQLGGNADRWLDVRKRLPLLRQKKFYRQTRYGFARGDEPVTYVGNIRRYYDTLVWLDEQGRIPVQPIQLDVDVQLPIGSGDGV